MMRSEVPVGIVRAMRGMACRPGRLLACVAALSAGGAQAATQGVIGATSTGIITITVSVPNRAQISGLNDVSFANVDPGSDVTNAQSDCVWSNTATKGYSITATGSGSSNAFTLVNGALAVPYTVQWAGSTGQSGGTTLTSGTALTGLTSTATTPTCASAPTTTSSLIVGMSAASLQSMQSQTTYSGTLALLVTPQ